jgi:hypothetical protein
MNTYRMMLVDSLGYFHLAHGERPEKNNNTHVYFKYAGCGNRRWMDIFP